MGLAVLGNGSQTVFGDRFSGEIDRNQQSIAHREALWEANWEIVKVHPWLGVGPWQNVKQLPVYSGQSHTNDSGAQPSPYYVEWIILIILGLFQAYSHN